MEESELEKLRVVQRQCRDAYLSADSDRERAWHMLGMADYLMEEVIELSQQQPAPGH